MAVPAGSCMVDLPAQTVLNTHAFKNAVIGLNSCGCVIVSDKRSGFYLPDFGDAQDCTFNFLQ